VVETVKVAACQVPDIREDLDDTLSWKLVVAEIDVW
jgi:hypothetical protein